MSKQQRSPLVGYNHNIAHLGRVFHVQTEDSGPSTPRLFTHLFFQGTILASLKHEYEATIAEDKVRGLMQGLHKSMIRDLLQAKFDEKLGAFFRARGEEIPAGPGALPSVPMAETPAPIPVPPFSPAGVTSGPARLPPEADSPSGVPLPIGPSRRNTRPIASISGARRAAPSDTPARALEGQRSVSMRNATPSAVKASPPLSTDAVVVERNVVIGGSFPSPQRPARTRPAVPYVVGGRTPGPSSSEGAVPSDNPAGPDNPSGRVSSAAVADAPSPPSDGPRTERNLDEAILEYLGDGRDE
jgi:hypothetical protein